MFSKGWTKIIILLFLVMLVPLLLDSFGIDIIEGAGPTSGGGGRKTAVGKGAVGKGAFEAKAVEDAMKAKAALDATLAEKAKAKAAAPADKSKASTTGTSTDDEEKKYIAELFTVNNDELKYAYALNLHESFTEGATSGKPPPICKYMNKYLLPITNDTKTSDKQKVDALKTKFDNIYKEKKCTAVMK